MGKLSLDPESGVRCEDLEMPSFLVRSQKA